MTLRCILQVSIPASGYISDLSRSGIAVFDALVSCKLMGRKPLYICTGVTDPLTGAGFSVTGLVDTKTNSQRMTISLRDASSCSIRTHCYFLCKGRKLDYFVSFRLVGCHDMMIVKRLLAALLQTVLPKVKPRSSRVRLGCSSDREPT
jgi:hypothetical protein